MERKSCTVRLNANEGATYDECNAAEEAVDVLLSSLLIFAPTPNAIARPGARVTRRAHTLDTLVKHSESVKCKNSNDKRDEPFLSRDADSKGEEEEEE